MITIENYEEYFLLYVDNELPAELRTAVERFAAEHPQTREELEVLLQCRVRPDQQESFADKASMLHEPTEVPERSEGNERGPQARSSSSDRTTISDLPGFANFLVANPRGNYDETLILYIDGELDARARSEVDALLQKDPAAAETLRRLRQTVSHPDPSLVFPDKESLYRYEKTRRVILLPWLRAGIAAAVLAAAALLLLPRGRKEPAQPAVAAKKVPAAVTPAGPRTLYSDKKEEKGEQNIEPNAEKEKAVYVSAKNKRSIPAAVKREEDGFTGTAANRPVIAQTTATADSANRSADLSIATIGSDKSKALPANTVAMVNIPREQSSFATQALIQEQQEEAGADQVVLTSETGGKNKFRGIFRRVSRAFGKTAERDNEGQREVLISAFQVALK